MVKGFYCQVIIVIINNNNNDNDDNAPVNVNPRTPRPGHSGAFVGNFALFDERKGHRYRGL